MLLSDLQAKDIINIKIIYFVSEERKLMRKVTHSGASTFDFEKIKKIGEDVILVEL